MVNGGPLRVGGPEGAPLQPVPPEAPREKGLIAWIKKIFRSFVGRAEQRPVGAVQSHHYVPVEEKGLAADISRLFRKLFGMPPQETVTRQVLESIKASIKGNAGIGAKEILQNMNALQSSISLLKYAEAMKAICEDQRQLNQIKTNNTSDLLRVHNLVEELVKKGADLTLDPQKKQAVIERYNDVWMPLVVQTIVNEFQLNKQENRFAPNGLPAIEKFDVLVTALSKMRQIPPGKSNATTSNIYPKVKEEIQKEVLKRLSNQ